MKKYIAMFYLFKMHRVTDRTLKTHIDLNSMYGITKRYRARFKFRWLP